MTKNNIAQAMKERDQTQQPASTQSQAATSDPKVAFLEAQVRSLQEQLQQRRQDEEESRMEKEAARLAQEKAVLEQEADLRRTLTSSLKDLSKDDDEPLTQKEMLAVMAEAVAKASEAQSKLMESKFSQLLGGTDQKIVNTQKALMEILAGFDIMQTRSQFTDFDNYRDDIAQIVAKTGLSSADAYILAKGRKASLSPDAKEVETERPNRAPVSFPRERVSREQEQTEEEPEVRNPRAAFKSAVSDAIDKILAARRK